MYILVIIALVLLVYSGYGDYKEAKETGNKEAIRFQQRALILVLSGLMLCVVVFYAYPYLKFLISALSNKTVQWPFYILFSFCISFLWFVFFRALDIFEPEKGKSLFILFLLSCGSTYLVFPISDFLTQLGFYLDGTFLNDFVYCTIRIGLVEEVAKVLPFLLVLRFSKDINEPFDYLLYAAVSALGFAFIENVMYLERTNMMSLTGRAFYSTVAHIFDSSIIGYCLAIAHYKKTSGILAFFKGLALAALAHGFYDFWLISEGYKFFVITIAFFLLSIHLLTLMVNNLINISPYYKPERRLRAARYKFYLTTCLMLLCIGGFLFVLLMSGKGAAVYFAESTVVNQLYVLVYLVVSFTSLNVIHGYLKPFNALSTNILLPVVNRYPNYIGLHIRLRQIVLARNPNQKLVNNALPAKFTLGKRVVVEKNINWYFINAHENYSEWEVLGAQMICAPVKFDEHLESGNTQLFQLAFIREVADLEKVQLTREALLYLGTAQVMVVKELP